MGLAGLIWDPQETRHINRFFGTSGFQIGDTLMPWSRFITIVVGLGLALGLKILLSRTRLGVAMRAVVDNRELAGAQRHQARPGVDVLVGARLVDGRGRRHLPRRGARHPRRADAHAADPRRVRGRDHRPAEEPAAHVRGRSAHRARVRVPAELPELDRPLDDRAAGDPADHAVPRVAVPAPGAHRGQEGDPPGGAADPEDPDRRVRDGGPVRRRRGPRRSSPTASTSARSPSRCSPC